MIINNTAATVIGMEICKFSTYQACEKFPEPGSGVDQWVITSGPAANETGRHLRSSEKAATLACPILALAAVTYRKEFFASGQRHKHKVIT